MAKLSYSTPSLAKKMKEHNIYEPPKSKLEIDENFYHVRSKILTVFLWLLIVGNIVSIIHKVLYTNEVLIERPALSAYAVYALVLCSFLNIIFVIALLKWKKWGFWGICFTASCIFSINVVGLGFNGSLLKGTPGFFLLFLLLHIGGERKAWAQLE